MSSLIKVFAVNRAIKGWLGSQVPAGKMRGLPGEAASTVPVLPQRAGQRRAVLMQVQPSGPETFPEGDNSLHRQPEILKANESSLLCTSQLLLTGKVNENTHTECERSNFIIMSLKR